MNNAERNKDKEVSIYIIKSYGNVIYVGQTTDFEKRKKKHIYDSICDLRKREPLYEYMYNNEYEFELVKKCSYKDRFKEENSFIEYYSELNVLYNKPNRNNFSGMAYL